MTEFTKAALDAMTDQVIATLRDGEQLTGLEAQYARLAAGHLATQFPDVPDLSRIVVACAHHMSSLSAEGMSGAVVVGILAGTGLRLGDEVASGG